MRLLRGRQGNVRGRARLVSFVARHSRPISDGAPRVTTVESIDSAIAVAFVGTYGPRRCGIATFTADLAAAVAGNDRRVLPMVLAVTEPSGQYQYPAEVKFEIRQNVKADYVPRSSSTAG